MSSSSNTGELPSLKKVDTIVHNDDNGPELNRVVLICLDPESSNVTFQWALDNFIVPSKDLVNKRRRERV
ncbi:uncharacterized protein BX663DRAFT_496257 [Cokeromyces recurvatus]|uniref:uncharacterized protein n=1 Tax=Cokeromyces recurvatus TaxID=90255 RepID=UPI00221ED0A9|nr:uncharacterized protein BX663DRAFT_496257 [Cokeromyces recurvatus]KAI7906390.1 hypothetical protein BX663DRAFT_496257 [Cokeromyces recurvatus]